MAPRLPLDVTCLTWAMAYPSPATGLQLPPSASAIARGGCFRKPAVARTLPGTSALGFQLPRGCMCFLSCQCAAFLVLRLLLSVPLSSQDDHRKYGPRWDANKTTVPAHHRCLCHASKHHAFGWTTNASGTSWSRVGCGWGSVRGLIGCYWPALGAAVAGVGGAHQTDGRCHLGADMGMQVRRETAPAPV